MLRYLVFPAMFCTATAFGIETRELQLRASGDTGEVSIVRDVSGNIVFSDVSTSPTTLYDLARRPTLHSTLDGLIADDHPHYLDNHRHDAAHDEEFNGALPIGDDANGNPTLGAHVSDGDIHVNRTEDETIVGTWSFPTATFADGGIALGESVYTEQPAIRFADSPPAEIVYDNDTNTISSTVAMAIPALTVESSLDGDGSASLSNFASIAGIASADLLSSTRTESVSEPWSFLGGIESRTITQDGFPSVHWRVVNAGSGSISEGHAVKWAAISDETLGVESIAGEATAAVGFAGFAAEDADEDDPLTIVVSGVAVVAVSGTAAAGSPVAWDGSGVGPVGPTFGYAQVGIALEPLSGSGTARIYIQRAIHPAP